MTAPLIDIRLLKIVPGGGKGKYSHPIDKRVIPGYARVFFSKEMKSPRTARLETLAQEFFRLIIPTQPRTRVAYNPASNVYYTLSEEVLEFSPLPTGCPDQFAKGAFPNLGRIMLVSILLHEVDLKNGNIGLDKLKNVVKIDGDWCFAAIRYRAFSYKEITPKLLDNLPFIVGYDAFNWLDIYQQGIAQFSSIVDENLTVAEHFRAEINEAILKVALLPEFYIRALVDSFMPIRVEADQFISFLKRRCEELALAGLSSESFIQYFLSGAARECVVQHLHHLKTFKVHGDYAILKPEELEVVDAEVKKKYDRLFSAILREEENPCQTSFLSIADANEHLKKIKIDFYNIKSKEELNDYYIALFKQLRECSKSVDTSTSPTNEQEEYTKFIAAIELKKTKVSEGVRQLELRFNLLEKMNFNVHIEILLQKHKDMIAKSLRNSNYAESAKQLAVLYTSLTKIKKAFLYTDQTLEQAKKAFGEECVKAFVEVKKNINHHREWAGQIRKFLADVLIVLSCGFLKSHLGIFAKTDSSKKVNDLENTIATVLNN